jgi:hypothetical protein
VTDSGQGLRARDLVPLAIAVLLPLIPIVDGAGLLAAIPFLAIVIPLLLGRFPGESVIDRLVTRRRSHAPVRKLGQPPRPAVSGLLRARLLIAASLAERPPPALPAT